MSPRLLVRLLVVVLVCAGTASGVVTSPASAAVCSSSSGVSVVVDFTGNPDGGGATSACDPNGADDSARNVFNRHYSLQDHPQERGYVCRIDGRPASGECQGTNAYWGLFHSNGRDGTWTYASTGVDGLSVPAGGSVAFAWQDGGGIDQPRIAPPVHRSEPSPTAEPTTSSPSATSSPTTSPSTSATSPSSSPGAATDEDTRAQRLRRRADREARAQARAGEQREAREEQRREVAADARAERRREAREERRRERESVETAPAQSAPYDDGPATSDAASDSAAGQVPTWLTVLVLLGMALLAVLLAVLRRRAARAG